MKIGLFGAATDSHTAALVSVIERCGAESVVIESRAMLQGVEHTFDGSTFVAGKPVADLDVCYLRYVIATHYRPDDGQPPVEDPNLRLHASYQLGWIETLLDRGIPVVNPPAASGPRRAKVRQLAAANDLGLRIPRTRITNSVEEIMRLTDEVASLIHKPLDGGATCQILDLVAWQPDGPVLSYPLIVQELIEGDAIRVTMVGDEVVSCVRIDSDYLDYRDDPAYQRGEITYEPVPLPETMIGELRAFMRRCRLSFSGIDLIDTGTGYVFLEANSSPLWLEIESHTGAPITARLVDHLLLLGKSPALFADWA